MDLGYALPLLLLAVVPLGLVLVTSFLKFSIVLAFLRQALGSPDVPPSIVLLAVAVLLSGFVMAPTGVQMARAAQPLVERGEGEPALSELSAAEAFQVAEPVMEPLLVFLERHAGAAERAVFTELGKSLYPPEERSLAAEGSPLVLVSAFVLTELKEAFLIGFVVFIPFLVVELAVANILLSLNMHMLNPTSVSLPFKLLLFVLVDGWTLLVQGLILGYGS
jgi:type III secretion protein R